IDELFADLANNDLHIGNNYPAYNFISDNAQNISIVDDIDGDVRCPDASCPGNAALPDMGADEFVACPNPYITAQPDSQIICPGNTWFRVNDEFGPNTYTWQVSDDNGSSWNDLSNTGIYAGADTDSLQLNGATSTENG